MSKITIRTPRQMVAAMDDRLEHLDPELLTKTTTTLYQLQWKFNHQHAHYDDQWHDLEHELWKPADWANERLKYWQSLSLSRVLEFRVEKVERKLK